MNIPKFVYFCPYCHEEIQNGWGQRVECPHCEKWVTTKKVKVKAYGTSKKGNVCRK